MGKIKTTLKGPENHLAWLAAIKNQLITEDVEDALTKAKPAEPEAAKAWRKQQAKALQFVLNTIPDSMVERVGECESITSALQIIEREYGYNNGVAGTLAMQELCSITMDSKGNLREFIHRFGVLINRVEQSTKEKLKEDMKVNNLLRALPPSLHYISHPMMAESITGANLPYDTVVAKLMAQSILLDQAPPPNPPNTTTTTTTPTKEKKEVAGALRAEGESDSSEERRRPRRDERRCYACQDFGHIARNCTDRKAKEQWEQEMERRDRQREREREGRGGRDNARGGERGRRAEESESEEEDEELLEARLNLLRAKKKKEEEKKKKEEEKKKKEGERKWAGRASRVAEREDSEESGRKGWRTVTALVVATPINPTSALAAAKNDQHVWILDSGAINHMCTFKENFSSLRPLSSPILVCGIGRNNNPVKATHIGDVLLRPTDEKCTGGDVLLRDVLYAPDLGYNLVSGSVIAEKGGKIYLFKGGCEVSLNNEVLLTGTVRDDSFLLSAYVVGHQVPRITDKAPSEVEPGGEFENFEQVAGPLQDFEDLPPDDDETSDYEPVEEEEKLVDSRDVRKGKNIQRTPSLSIPQVSVVVPHIVPKPDMEDDSSSSSSDSSESEDEGDDVEASEDETGEVGASEDETSAIDLSINLGPNFDFSSVPPSPSSWKKAATPKVSSANTGNGGDSLRPSHASQDILQHESEPDSPDRSPTPEPPEPPDPTKKKDKGKENASSTGSQGVQASSPEQESIQRTPSLPLIPSSSAPPGLSSSYIPPSSSWEQARTMHPDDDTEGEVELLDPGPEESEAEAKPRRSERLEKLYGARIVAWLPEPGIPNSYAKAMASPEMEHRQAACEREMEAIGLAKLIIGIAADQTDKGISISQAGYLREFVKSIGMLEASPVAIPLAGGVEKDLLTREATSLHPLAMYAAVGTRPDLSKAMSFFGRFNVKPAEEYLAQLKRLVRYLDYAIHYPAGNGQDLKLEMYADASWSDDQEDRKSTGSYVALINGAPISWSSNKQRPVALSSAEAEYMSVTQAAKEAVWLRRILKELGFEQKGPTTIWVNNQSVIAIAKNQVDHKRSKHINIAYHFTREKVEEKEIILRHVSTTKQTADILMEPLDRATFEAGVKLLGLVERK